MKITRDVPASTSVAHELHERLAEAGQALRDTELRSFLLSIRSDDGSLRAGCKGEIAFASAHISEIWVAESLRGRGVGRLLLAEAERLARDQGCHRIHLETRNESARRLYERVGYRVFGTLPRYAGDQAFYYLEKNVQYPPAEDQS